MRITYGASRYKTEVYLSRNTASRALRSGIVLEVLRTYARLHIAKEEELTIGVVRYEAIGGPGNAAIPRPLPREDTILADGADEDDARTRAIPGDISRESSVGIARTDSPRSSRVVVRARVLSFSLSLALGT